MVSDLTRSQQPALCREHAVLLQTQAFWHNPSFFEPSYEAKTVLKAHGGRRHAWRPAQRKVLLLLLLMQVA